MFLRWDGGFRSFTPRSLARSLPVATHTAGQWHPNIISLWPRRATPRTRTSPKGPGSGPGPGPGPGVEGQRPSVPKWEGREGWVVLRTQWWRPGPPPPPLHKPPPPAAAPLPPPYLRGSLGETRVSLSLSLGCSSKCEKGLERTDCLILRVVPAQPPTQRGRRQGRAEDQGRERNGKGAIISHFSSMRRIPLVFFFFFLVFFFSCSFPIVLLSFFPSLSFGQGRKSSHSRQGASW